MATGASARYLEPAKEVFIESLPYQLVKMTPDLALIDPDQLAPRLRAVVAHGGLSQGLVVGVSPLQLDQTESTGS
jgi:hypothetical protein